MAVGCVVTPTSTPEPSPEPTQTATPTFAPPTPTPLPKPSPTPEYDRDDWGGWIDADGDCQNTRAEILIEESLVEPTLEGCRVVAGEWFDQWGGETYYSAGDVDIDHHVPLAHAHETGGSAWDKDLKVEFANDPVNLNAMSSSLNSRKGSRGPDEWQPPEEASYCEYARQWEAVKEKYQLRIAESERLALDAMLETCDSTLPTPTPPSRYLPVQPSSTPVPTGNVYGSCEEAEAAGEERIVGTNGPGRGFPQAMVPSARDGDRDGVVCEVSLDEDRSPTPISVPPTSSPSSAVYGSCEEAEAAGEERIVGGSGPGRGFPHEMVPSARDGDKDGVVCER